MHWPDVQVPAAVNLLALHVPVPHAVPLATFAVSHPSTGSQLSVVHGLPSSQTMAAPPWQLPPLHVSPLVHLLPSWQLAVLLVFLQPIVGSQLSLVQGF